MYGDSGDSQSSASPGASSERPRPGGGVSLDVAEDPCWDSQGEENRVDKSSGDEVEAFPDLRDGDVAAASRLPAVAMAPQGRGRLSHGGWWWYRVKRHFQKTLLETREATGMMA